MLSSNEDRCECEGGRGVCPECPLLSTITKEGMKNRNKEIEFDLTDPSYTPEKFLDGLKTMLNANSDYRLCEKLEVDVANISRIRNRKMLISASFLVRAAELTNMRMPSVFELAGLPPNYMPWKCRVKGAKNA
jgi:hypothetical protein